jgi:hypothetical protein
MLGFLLYAFDCYRLFDAADIQPVALISVT